MAALLHLTERDTIRQGIPLRNHDMYRSDLREVYYGGGEGNGHLEKKQRQRTGDRGGQKERSAENRREQKVEEGDTSGRQQVMMKV